MDDLLVLVCLVLALANMTNAITNAHLINMVQIKDADTFLGVHDIELVTVPHDATCMDLDRMESDVTPGRSSRYHQQHVAVLVGLGINKRYTNTFVDAILVVVIPRCQDDVFPAIGAPVVCIRGCGNTLRVPFYCSLVIVA